MSDLSIGIPRLITGWRELQRLHLNTRARRRDSVVDALALFRDRVNEDARRVEKDHAVAACKVIE